MSLVSRNSDEEYMRLALELAGLAKGHTSPNPMVGAVVVKDGEVVSTGFHARAEAPHAERVALSVAGQKARGATLYVNLEPCCHTGRTPPCVDAVIQSRVQRVVAAMEDPNPKVSGRGFARLGQAGIEVKTGVLELEAKRLNEAFAKFIVTRQPFVTYKVAASFDGHVATCRGDSRWISGENARRFSHQLRHDNDAIIVGVGTVLADDPTLNVRLTGEPPEADPVGVIIDTECRTPPTANVVRVLASSPAPTMVICAYDAPADRVKTLQNAGVVVVKVSRTRPERGPQARNSGLDLSCIWKELGRREITSAVLE